MKTNSALLIVAFFLFASTSAQACFAPSPEQTSMWQELVKRTDTILLAQVVSAKPVEDSSAVFQLKVLETIKGQSAPTFEMPGFVAGDKQSSVSTFRNHRDQKFWQDDTGSTIVSPDCSIKPAFTVGAKYLLFVEKPYHVKSFEKISDSKDQWLQKVKAQIQTAQK